MRTSTVWVVLTMAALVAGVARAGEAQPTQAAPYRFVGGEKVRLIVPAPVGEAVEQLVSEDGFISLPIGGIVNVKGKSIPEAQELVTELVSKEAGARRAFAAIALLEVPPRKIYIGGEVKTPQAINLPPGAPLTLAAALASAGGPTTEADLSRVRLVRVTNRGGNAVISYDASRLGQKETSDLGPALEVGDVITVPRGDVFVLAGEVAKPGTYSRRDLGLAARETAWLSRVVFAAGGLKPNANRKDVRIVRTTDEGIKQVVNVNFEQALRNPNTSEKERQSMDPPLQNGDIIVADSSGGAAILGKVKQPGVYPIGGDSIKLTRLIAQAGGFTEFAKTSSVIVIRATSPKTPIRIDVSAITKSGDPEKDLDLEDGDLVYVGERML